MAHKLLTYVVPARASVLLHEVGYFKITVGAYNYMSNYFRDAEFAFYVCLVFRKFS